MSRREYGAGFTITPIAGDLVFCTGNSLIKALQVLPSASNRKITHVAIMASDGELLEGMVGKKIEIQNAGQWLRDRLARNPKERHFVLRHERAWKNQRELQRRIAFYLSEPYQLSVMFDWQRPGASICTSFVAKVLTTCGLITGIAGPKDLFPGELFARLKGSGFGEIPSQPFVSGMIRSSDGAAFDRRLALARILDKLDTELQAAHGKMIGWTSIVARDLRTNPLDSIVLWERMAGGDLIGYAKEIKETAEALVHCIRALEHRGKHNWADVTEKHAQQIILLKQFVTEHFALIQIFSETLTSDIVDRSRHGVPANTPDLQIYSNIGYYLASIQIAAGSMRAILGTT